MRIYVAAFAVLIAVPSLAAPQDPQPSPSPTPSPVEIAPPNAQPTPAMNSVDGEDGSHDGRVRRALRHFLSDDDTGSGRGIHWGPFYPRVAILSAGSGLGPALHLWGSDIHGTPLDFHASAAYSFFKYSYLDAQFGLLPQDGEKLPRFETSTTEIFPLADLERSANRNGFSLYASIRARDYPREDFYGIGARSTEDQHTDYRLKDKQSEGVLRYGSGPVSFMGRVGILNTSILPGKDSKVANTEAVFSEASAPGLTSAPDFNFFTGGVWLEFRDAPGNPHKGAAFGAAYSRFNDRHADRFEFSQISFQGREFVPLGSHRHVLAFHESLLMDRPAPGHEIPFYLRSTLGGSFSFPGYPSFRFRDDRQLYMIGEYRFEATPKIELALIYEKGKVFSRSEGVNFKNLRNAWGGGIRFKSPRKVHARLDIVHGDEGIHIQAKLTKSF